MLSCATAGLVSTGKQSASPCRASPFAFQGQEENDLDCAHYCRNMTSPPEAGASVPSTLEGLAEQVRNELTARVAEAIAWTLRDLRTELDFVVAGQALAFDRMHDRIVELRELVRDAVRGEHVDR